jgi:hypothetical protein
MPLGRASDLGLSEFDSVLLRQLDDGMYLMKSHLYANVFPAATPKTLQQHGLGAFVLTSVFFE